MGNANTTAALVVDIDDRVAVARWKINAAQASSNGLYWLLLPIRSRDQMQRQRHESEEREDHMVGVACGWTPNKEGGN